MPGGKVHCYLCPRHCHIGAGQAGFCFIRVNEGGKLYQPRLRASRRAANRSHRKKAAESFPARHARLFPGHRRLQHGLLLLPELGHLEVARAIRCTRRTCRPRMCRCWRFANGCPSIAFTYNEPTIWGEYVIDICRAAKDYGINTVMVTNGYITYEAFHDIYDHIDAANVDLKAFTENFYGTHHAHAPAARARYAEWLKNETNVWFEITNLMIPTLNDDRRRNAQACRMDSRTSGAGRAAAFHRVSSRFQAAGQAAHAARNSARAPAPSRSKLACITSTKAIFIATARTPLPDVRDAADSPLLARRAGKSLERRPLPGLRPRNSRPLDESTRENSAARLRPRPRRHPIQIFRPQFMIPRRGSPNHLPAQK